MRSCFHLIVFGLICMFGMTACNGGGGGGDADADDVSTDETIDDVPADDAGGPDTPDVQEEDAAVDVPAEGGDAGDLDVAEEEPVDPLAEFERFCEGEEWDADLVPASVWELGGEYMGYYSRWDVPETLEMMKVIPEHPFHVEKVKVQFANTGGTAKIRLMKTQGRSYPGGWSDLDAPGVNLMEPVELVVSSSDLGSWMEIDVSDQDIFLLPTEHYAIVYEHMTAAPYLAVEEVTEGNISWALIIIPGETYPYGVDGNYSMQLEGSYFCTWDMEDRWFDEDLDQPFGEDRSSRAAIADLNNDDHDDLIINVGGPVAYFGDGEGNFTVPETEPFPEVSAATMLVFGDLDNDGDVDAFSATSVSMERDGDGVTKQEGDCNDADADVYPGADEDMDNGMDDNCDGVIDDGTDTSDADGDGVTIAEGDCDDNRDDVYPGAPELLDDRDNDCDLTADEDHVNSIQVNDGTGVFSTLEEAGVERFDDSPAGALGDGDGDGDLDLYYGNWRINPYVDLAAPDMYMTNNGDGTFTDATEAAGLDLATSRACYGVGWADYNNDGLQDIWVGNYYHANMLFENNGDGTFTDVALELGIARDEISRSGCTFGGDFGDINNDGYLDHYTANLSHPRNQPWSDISQVLINQGPPDYNFVNMREELGFIYDEGDQNVSFADFDNDMDLDIYVASIYATHFGRFYRNDGDEGFTDVTYESGTLVRTAGHAVWTDVDEDGDLDLIVASGAGARRVHLFVNLVGQDKNWIELLLEGVDTNKDAIGARVTLTAGDVTQIREVKGGGGHSNQQSTLVVHFGLADETAIDEVTVRWAGGELEAITGLEPGGRYRVVEGSGTGVPIE